MSINSYHSFSNTVSSKEATLRKHYKDNPSNCNDIICNDCIEPSCFLSSNKGLGLACFEPSKRVYANETGATDCGNCRMCDGGCGECMAEGGLLGAVSGCACSIICCPFITAYSVGKAINQDRIITQQKPSIEKMD